MIAVDTQIRQPTPRLDSAATGASGNGTRHDSPLATLVDGVRHAPSLVAQGAMLRALDGATGSRGASDALVRGEAPAPAQQAGGGGGAAKAPTYTDKSLYVGQPKADDIRQDALGDCYFVATLGAVAQQRPQVIRDAISYDAKTASFNVRLYDNAGKAQTINVTQAEVADNVKRQGGSTMDNTGGTSPAWPAVMEAAYAKMHDSKPANGLTEGYNAISHGGWPADAMRAITGNAGSELKFSQGFFQSHGSALDQYGKQVELALKAGKPVTAWSVVEGDSRSLWGKLTGAPVPQDGLVDNHVYTVQSIAKDASGEWQVTLRNPWATNMGVGEGKDTPNASITVPLRTLVDTGGLNSFRVGN